MSVADTSKPISTRGPNPRFWPPRAAYVHVPFCRHRCGYCNFTLVAGRDDLVECYLQALHAELSWLEQPREIETLYFGGGTPTHLSPAQLRRLVEIARHWFLLTTDHEMTVEANPLDISPARLEVLQQGGTTRISLGVQSFDEQKLAVLERDHRQYDIQRAWELACRAIPVVSIDLIFGVPGETLTGWQADLQAAIRLSPQHLSVYGLTWERGTSFWSRLRKGELVACPEDLERSMYEAAIDLLSAAGYEHYEVSSFAQPGYRCRHNEVYWTGRTYFAAGPGAARYIDGRRELNHRSTTSYLNRTLAGRSPVAESEMLSPEDSARERLVFGLRRLEGIDTTTLASETGFEIEQLAGAALSRFSDLGLIKWRDGRIRLTRAGLLISDSLWPELLGSQ